MGFNHYLYRPVADVEPRYDASFVGQPCGNGRAVAELLRCRGVTVRAWGHGWPAGRLAQEERIRVFSESRINLNLANTATRAPLRSAARVLLDAALGSHRRGHGAADPERIGLGPALAEHTYVHRFNEIFTAMGLDVPPVAQVSSAARVGETLEMA